MDYCLSITFLLLKPGEIMCLILFYRSLPLDIPLKGVFWSFEDSPPSWQFKLPCDSLFVDTFSFYVTICLKVLASLTFLFWSWLLEFITLLFGVKLAMEFIEPLDCSRWDAFLVLLPCFNIFWRPFPKDILIRDSFDFGLSFSNLFVRDS